MDQVRTDNQKRADQELEEAILNCLKAYGWDPGEIVADFVVLCATNKIHEDGVIQTNYPMLMAGGDIPWYRVMGLIDQHRIMCERMMGSDNG